VSRSGGIRDILIPFETVIGDLRQSGHGGGQRKKGPRLPVRDFQMFFPSISRQYPGAASGGNGINFFTLNRSQSHGQMSARILPRISSNCFLLEIEHIKMLCQHDKCLILHPDQGAPKAYDVDANDEEGEEGDDESQHVTAEAVAVEEFVRELSRNLKPNSATLFSTVNSIHPNAQAYLNFFVSSSTIDEDGQIRSSPFEMLVLETVLSYVTKRLQHHCSKMHALLEVLIEETLSANPPTRMMLRRTLAFKQNLKQFEKNVFSVGQAIQNVLGSDQDMADLYLTHHKQNPNVIRDASDHDEVELLLETYAADLQHLHLDLSRMRAALEDADDFVNIHLSTKRNQIIRLSLFMDMATLSLASGALVAGGMGMNLTNGFEEHPTAFYVTSGATLTFMAFLFAKLMRRFRMLDFEGASQAKRGQYHALKNYQLVLDQVETSLKFRYGQNGTRKSNKAVVGQEDSLAAKEHIVTREEFEGIIQKIVPSAQPDEIDLIFKSFDTNKSGTVEHCELESDEKSGGGGMIRTKAAWLQMAPAVHHIISRRRPRQK